MFEDFKFFKTGFIIYNIIYIIMVVSKVEFSYLILYNIVLSILLLLIFEYEKKKRINEILDLIKPKNLDNLYDSYIDLTFKELNIIYQNKELNNENTSNLISLLNLKLNVLFEILRQKEKESEIKLKAKKRN
jgi:hypothetical protein